MERARDAFRKAVTRIEIQSYETATLGWRQSATEVVLQPPGRPNFVYITKSDGTRTVALNEANVPLNAFLPVKIRLENNTIVIKGQNVAATNALTNLPPSPYGVSPHPHALSGLSDVLLTSLADGQILAWDNAAGKWVNVTEAGALVASVNGQTGAVVLDSDDIAEGSTNLYISDVELIKLAGIETAADVTDLANVGAAVNAAAADTPLDADKHIFWDVVDSVLKSITHVNLKALLKTYFDTLYVVLAGMSGGQHLKGGTDANDDLTLEGTAHATKTSSYVLLQPNGGNVAIGKSSAERLFVLSAASNPAFAIDGPAIDFSANQQTAFGAYADEASSFTLANNLTGGSWFKSFNKAAASGIGSYFTSYSENDLTTFSSFELVAGKHNGSGARTAHGANARILSILNHANNLFNLMGSGNLGLGTIAPLGRLHTFDGLGGSLVWSQLGITSAVTVIPDGTGDVLYGMYVNAVVLASDGSVQGSGPAAAILPGAGVTLYNSGVNSFALNISAGGAVTVARTGGALTYACVLKLIWM